VDYSEDLAKPGVPDVHSKRKKRSSGRKEVRGRCLLRGPAVRAFAVRRRSRRGRMMDRSGAGAPVGGDIINRFVHNSFQSRSCWCFSRFGRSRIVVAAVAAAIIHEERDSAATTTTSIIVRRWFRLTLLIMIRRDVADVCLREYPRQLVSRVIVHGSLPKINDAGLVPPQLSYLACSTNELQLEALCCCCCCEIVSAIVCFILSSANGGE
jgi:hypothetical protein